VQAILVRSWLHQLTLQQGAKGLFLIVSPNRTSVSKNALDRHSFDQLKKPNVPNVIVIPNTSTLKRNNRQHRITDAKPRHPAKAIVNNC